MRIWRIHFRTLLQSSRGLEQSKTLRVFDGHRIARNVLECGSPLPLSSADAGERSEIFWQRTDDAAPTGLGNFGLGFYKDGAPAALKNTLPRAKGSSPPIFVTKLEPV